MNIRQNIFLPTLVGAIAIFCAALAVPVYPDRPETFTETPVSVALSNSGEKILLRTKEHDYEFQLPPNRLLRVLDPTLSDYYNSNEFSDMLFSPSDSSVKAKFRIRLGGYYRQASEIKSTLPAKQRAILETYGFKETNGNDVGDFDPSLYMEWSSALEGHQFGKRSRDDKDQWVELAEVAGWARLDVTINDPETLQSNRRMNAIFEPIVALREGIAGVVWKSIFVVMALFGIVGMPGG